MFDVRRASGIYLITQENILSVKGGKLLVIYGYSPFRLLHAVYPEFNLAPWRFHMIPNIVSRHPEIRQSSVDWLMTKLNVCRYLEMLSITVDEVRAAGGKSIIKLFSNSLKRMVQTVYEAYRFPSWRFYRTERKMWRTLDELTHIADLTLQRLGVATFRDFKSVTSDRLKSVDAESLVSQFHYSPHMPLQKVYFEYRFKPWDLSAVPKSTWSDAATVTHYMDALLLRLNIYRYSDCYSLKIDNVGYDIYNLVKILSTTPSALVEDVYGRLYRFFPWCFSVAPYGTTRDPLMLRHNLDQFFIESNVRRFAELQQFDSSKLIEAIKQSTLSLLLLGAC